MALINTTTTGVLGSTFFADGTGSLTIQENGVTINEISSTGLLYGRLTSMTAQASTSGTSIDFTSIPSWVKRITVMFSGVSVSGTSPQIIQLGDSGGIEITGYLGAASTSSGTSTNNDNYTTGFGLIGISAPSAATITHGSVTITALDSATNLWVCAGVLGISSSAATSQIGGSKTLSATLDRIRITTVGGANTFDAGSVNVLYE
jgi:hypothetical protein